RNRTSAWAATGLFPFNPDRVLRDTSKPPPEVSVLKEVTVESWPQDEMLDMPVTPVTPVTTEAVASLHNVIAQDAHMLDQTSKQRLQRHVRKLAGAAQISFAKRALLQDQNRFLSKMNNEAKVRRSTKSQVLGKAKVMSYEDLEEAQAKRKEKEKAVAGKAARGRKRKAPALVVDVTELRSQVIQAREADLAKTPAELTREVPVPWRAPVAQMIPKNHRGGA
ncbi:hypothetical protein EK21DRAFT_79734, partial [Setomelanomma holmii]